MCTNGTSTLTPPGGGGGGGVVLHPVAMHNKAKSNRRHMGQVLKVNGGWSAVSPFPSAQETCRHRRKCGESAEAGPDAAFSRDLSIISGTRCSAPPALSDRSGSRDQARRSFLPFRRWVGAGLRHDDDKIAGRDSQTPLVGDEAAVFVE